VTLQQFKLLAAAVIAGALGLLAVQVGIACAVLFGVYTIFVEKK